MGFSELPPNSHKILIKKILLLKAVVPTFFPPRQTYRPKIFRGTLNFLKRKMGLLVV